MIKLKLKVIKKIKEIEFMDKIVIITPKIFFGVISGLGLFMMISLIIKLLGEFIPYINKYSVPIFLILYLIVFIGSITSFTFAKGLFRKSYLISTIIIIFLYIYQKITGGSLLS